MTKKTGQIRVGRRKEIDLGAPPVPPSNPSSDPSNVGPADAPKKPRVCQDRENQQDAENDQYHGSGSQRMPCPDQKPCSNHSMEADGSVKWLTPGDLERLHPDHVLLNVYDITRFEAFEIVNELTQPFGGGAFHVGVQVFGREYSFGMAEKGSQGVYIGKPREHPYHRYRGSILLGQTELSSEKVKDLIFSLEKEWIGTEYNIISRNCCSFARALAKDLGVHDVPEWIDSVSRSLDKLGGSLIDMSTRAVKCSREALDFRLDLRLTMSNLIKGCGCARGY